MEFKFSGDKVRVNVTTRAILMSEVRDRFRTGRGFTLATINMDHLVKMRQSSPFSRAYAAQDLVVADGQSIVALLRLPQQRVELMPGSDLIVPLCLLASHEQVSVALVGSTSNALDDAAKVIESVVPGIMIAVRIAPSAVFDPGGHEADQILDEVAASGARLCFLALGAPKQESLALRGRVRAPGVVFASVGAGLDFLCGHQVRAPRWIRSIMLEWLWRALSSPRRLLPRYLRCFAVLPRYVLMALRERSMAP